jgi:hypothetical protein
MWPSSLVTTEKASGLWLRFYNSSGTCRRCNDVLLSARRRTNKTTCSALVLREISVYGDAPLKLVLLRIVTVLVSVVVALWAAAYTSAQFDYEIYTGFREGTPISAIVFVSVFIPLFVFLVATGAWLLNRKYMKSSGLKLRNR